MCIYIYIYKYLHYYYIILFKNNNNNKIYKWTSRQSRDCLISSAHLFIQVRKVKFDNFKILFLLLALSLVISFFLSLTNPLETQDKQPIVGPSTLLSTCLVVTTFEHSSLDGSSAIPASTRHLLGQKGHFQLLSTRIGLPPVVTTANFLLPPPS